MAIPMTSAGANVRAMAIASAPAMANARRKRKPEAGWGVEQAKISYLSYT
jgi:hypothetical protein